MGNSEYSHRKEIYNFLAHKMLASDCDRKKVLFFWIDLLIQEFEQKYHTRFDSEDRERARKAIENWYHANLLETIHGISIAGDFESGANRIKNAVLFRAKYILRDLIYRPRKEKEERKEKKREERKQEKEPADSPRRKNRHVFPATPEKQDFLFTDSEFDGERLYLRREMVGELMKIHKADSLEELIFILAGKNAGKNRGRSQKTVEEYIETLRNKESLLSTFTDQSPSSGEVA